MSGLFRRLRYGAPIIVVSGLPRSGTSMMMRMLEAGGVPILTDGVRAADESNPYGYFEFEPVKQLDKTGGDLSWLPRARGKAVKIISFLLTWLPETYDYRVVFMERDLAEVLRSQNKMMTLAGNQSAIDNDGQSGHGYIEHLQQVKRFLANRRCFTTLWLTYRDVVNQPLVEAGKIAGFVGTRLDIDRMAAAVDPTLYRNRGG